MKCLLFLIFTELEILGFLFAILMGMKWYVIVVLTFISLLMKHLFQMYIKMQLGMQFLFPWIFYFIVFVCFCFGCLIFFSYWF